MPRDKMIKEINQILNKLPKRENPQKNDNILEPN